MSQVIDKYNDDLIVLGARPAIGKSTFLASLAKILFLDNDIPTVVFCPEMAKEVFVRRILQIVLGVSREDIASDDFWDIFDNKQVDNSVADICEMVKTEDIHPPKTGISVHFCVLSLMAMQK